VHSQYTVYIINVLDILPIRLLHNRQRQNPMPFLNQCNARVRVISYTVYITLPVDGPLSTKLSYIYHRSLFKNVNHHKCNRPHHKSAKQQE